MGQANRNPSNQSCEKLKAKIKDVLGDYICINCDNWFAVLRDDKIGSNFCTITREGMMSEGLPIKECTFFIERNSAE